jgi:hypothetical protein
MRLTIVFAVLLVGSVSSALAKECRTSDLPPGVQVQLPPGCKPPLRADRTKGRNQDRLRANEGFIDLGNGTQVRIGGRVRAEMGVRP